MTTDRRLIMQVIDYWECIRGERPFPLIADLDLGAVDAMAAHSFLIAIDRESVDASCLRYIGPILGADCEIELNGAPVARVPRGTLMSRLTDHHLQVVANRCPMGFEAEFSHAPGMLTQYRGIMLPFSETGEEVDYVLGTINSRQVPDGQQRPEAQTPSSTEEDGEGDRPHPTVDGQNTLFAKLCDGRAMAYMLEDAEERARTTTYEVLRQAFLLARAAREQPDSFRALAAGHGIDVAEEDVVSVALKLVFGRTYNTHKLVRFAAAFRAAEREYQTGDTVIAFLIRHDPDITRPATENAAIEIPSLDRLRVG